MPEANYSIDHDLEEANALAEHLIPYVYENELYGSIGGMFGSMPRLTIGGLLLRLHRLHALEDQMSDAQKAQLAEIDAKHESARQEWTVHYNDKLLQEAESRLKMMEQYFNECADDPRTCANNYNPEAMRRTIVQEIDRQLKQTNAPSAKLEHTMTKVDSQLRRFTQPSGFLWASVLLSVYPQGEYWWLYARPPRAETR